MKTLPIFRGARLMKSFWFFALLSLLISCEDFDLKGAASISGVPFVPDELSITSTGTGIQVVLKKDSEIITIWLSEKKSGTYEIIPNNPKRQVDCLIDLSKKFVVAEYSNTNNKIYHAVSGTITMDIDKHGVKGSFDFYAETPQDEEVYIKGGSFQGAIKEPAYKGCRVQSTEYIHDLEYTRTYGYGASGQLVSIISNEGPNYVLYYFFSYDGANVRQVTKLIYNKNSQSNYSCPEHYMIEYNEDKVSKIVSQIFIDNMTFEYNASGQLIKIGYNSVPPVDIYYYYALDGNVTQENGIEYKAYDDHPNFSQLFLESLNNQPAIMSYFRLITFPSIGSKNNPIKIGNFSYVYSYNSNGYPIKITTPDFPFGELNIRYRKCY